MVDAASAQTGAVSPGKVVVLYGDRLGPATLAGSQVSNGVLSNSLANAQVLFAAGVPRMVDVTGKSGDEVELAT